MGIFIYCEGEVTERFYIEDYFSQMAKNSGVVLVGIQEGAGSPDTIVKACLEHEAEDDTIVWAVFDVDEHQDLDVALVRARDNAIPVSLSDPCFEIWGLLHADGCDKPMSRKQAQRALANVMPGFHHDKNPRFDWAWCVDKIPAAIRNAESGLHNRLQESSVAPKANPSSNFHYLLLFAAQPDGELRKQVLEAAQNICSPPTKKPAEIFPPVCKSPAPQTKRKGGGKP
ncbi:RloB domain-containing protein [bacterium M00.F.Ca.ET.228.01.1.1]|nr:RloB domain-containing protein [bacterium M00.F.Ca.ET.228.01.1.1]TGR99031.1 RloB domain-containing protein [bacterium M00.F.Ca.ET.191.01.1.1]TGU03343.1 RloB domain-containing protein [bacterium M00.F.Ca.ET.155.01.1.1]